MNKGFAPILLFFAIGLLGITFYYSSNNGKFCGGIDATNPKNQCATGFVCKYTSNNPDSSGTCQLGLLLTNNTEQPNDTVPRNPEPSPSNQPSLIINPNIKRTPTPTPKPNLEGYYSGQISPIIPYADLKFKEVDVHNLQALQVELDESDYHYGEKVIDGYTFTAKEGEDFEFLAGEDRNSNPASFIRTELYGWGPTVIKMDTRIGWGVPINGRYFYVVIGEDFYGPNFVVPDGSGRTYDGSKYGKYTLKITQRKFVD